MENSVYSVICVVCMNKSNNFVPIKLLYKQRNNQEIIIYILFTT